MLATAFVIGFTSCKKEKQDPTINEETEVSVVTDDEMLFSTDIESLNLDLALLLETYNEMASPRNQEQPEPICGATAQLDQNFSKVTVTFNGNTCDGNRKRSGKIIVTLPAGLDWGKKGAVLSLQFSDYKITRLSDNKSIVINGVQKYTNSSGGWLSTSEDNNVIRHSITSDGLSLKFDNGDTREWKISKNRAFAKTYGNKWLISIEGTHTDHIAVWGTNRLGLPFSTATIEPLIVLESCGFKLTEGTIKHTVANVSATLSFGLDADGAYVGCPSDGKSYFSLDYTSKNGREFNFIFPY